MVDTPMVVRYVRGVNPFGPVRARERRNMSTENTSTRTVKAKNSIKFSSESLMVLARYEEARRAAAAAELNLAAAREALEAAWPQGTQFPSFFPFEWQAGTRLSAPDLGVVSDSFLELTLSTAAVRRYQRETGGELPFGVAEKAYWALQPRKGAKGVL